jgi:hypothetical protein
MLSKKHKLFSIYSPCQLLLVVYIVFNKKCLLLSSSRVRNAATTKTQKTTSTDAWKMTDRMEPRTKQQMSPAVTEAIAHPSFGSRSLRRETHACCCWITQARSRPAQFASSRTLCPEQRFAVAITELELICVNLVSYPSPDGGLNVLTSMMLKISQKAIVGHVTVPT